MCLNGSAFRFFFGPIFAARADEMVGTPKGEAFNGFEDVGGTACATLALGAGKGGNQASGGTALETACFPSPAIGGGDNLKPRNWKKSSVRLLGIRGGAAFTSTDERYIEVEG